MLDFRWSVAGFVVCTIMATVIQAEAQQNLGAKYHTREPRVCASMKEPQSGPPSAAQAAQYLACTLEGEYSRQLYLIGDVHVEVGKGTLYGQLSSISRPGNADSDGLVYAIRGGYKKYQCNVPTTDTPDGQQCTRYDNPRAEGTCYRTNFGDWYCNMSDGSNPNGASYQPPPQ